MNSISQAVRPSSKSIRSAMLFLDPRRTLGLNELEALRFVFFILDSRLRGNDTGGGGLFGLFGRVGLFGLLVGSHFRGG